jgi:hypothetical protein
MKLLLLGRNFLLFMGFILVSLWTYAQVDLSREILLKNRQPSSSPQQKAVSSGRYADKSPKAVPRKLPTKKAGPTTTTTQPDINEISVVLKPETAARPEIAPKKENGNKESGNKEIESLLFPTPAPVQNEVVTQDIAVPALAAQVKSLVLGEAPIALQKYVERVHPDDNRLNKIEIEIKTGFSEERAQSNFSPRKFKASQPFAELGGQVWLTPFLGLRGSLQSSLSGDIDPVTTLEGPVEVEFEQSRFFVVARNYFGTSRRAKSIEYGVGFSDQKMSLSSDSSQRMGLKNKGLGFTSSLRIPVVATYAWTLSGSLYPVLKYTEQSSTTGLLSGSSASGSLVEIGGGGEFKMSRTHQFIWSLNLQNESINFRGSPSGNDPLTGSNPGKVSVDEQRIQLQFGYRWGQ